MGSSISPTPACSRGYPAVPAPGAPSESTQCQDGVQNDGEGGIDFDGGQSIHGACSGGVCPPGVADANADGVAEPDSACGVGPGGTPEIVSLAASAQS